MRTAIAVSPRPSLEAAVRLLKQAGLPTEDLTAAHCEHFYFAGYLLTTTAETFFERHGYERQAREDAPAAIRATPEFAGICPASSAFMCRKLS